MYNLHFPRSRLDANIRMSKVASATLTSHRIYSYYAHALILFNVFGVPLSSGIWLEYYFNSYLLSTPLVAIAAIFAALVTFLGLAVGLATRLYCRWPKYWRQQMLCGLLALSGAWLALLISGEEWWVLFIFQGVFTGAGLGVLGTVSTLVLSTHYNNDLAVALTLCVAAGFAGAVVHTGLSWYCLRTDSVKMAYGINFALLSITLLLAVSLDKSHTGLSHFGSSSLGAAMTGKPTSWKLYLAISLSTVSLSVVFLFLPIYAPLLLSRNPTLDRADSGPYALLTLFSTAMFTAALLTKPPASHLPSVTLFTTATLLSGLAVLPIAWMQALYIAVPCAAVSGVGLGCACTFWVKGLSYVLATNGKADAHGDTVPPGLGRWVCVVMAIGGLVAGGGLVGAAAALDGWERGVQIVIGVSVSGWVLGGLVIRAGTAMRHVR